MRHEGTLRRSWIINWLVLVPLVLTCLVGCGDRSPRKGTKEEVIASATEKARELGLELSEFEIFCENDHPLLRKWMAEHPNATVPEPEGPAEPHRIVHFWPSAPHARDGTLEVIVSMDGTRVLDWSPKLPRK
jgi:hypothetical protein